MQTVTENGDPPSGKPNEEKTYKKTASSAIKGAIQLGIGYTVGNLTSKPDRDVLMQDFYVVESVFLPSEGSNLTPAHHYPDFRFKTYAPLAFRYFRELFGIKPDDYLVLILKTHSHSVIGKDMWQQVITCRTVVADKPQAVVHKMD